MRTLPSAGAHASTVACHLIGVGAPPCLSPSPKGVSRLCEARSMGMQVSEFGRFVQNLSPRVTANVGGSGTGGVAIARYRGSAGDESFQTASEQHILTMCAVRPARFEA